MEDIKIFDVDLFVVKNGLQINWWANIGFGQYNLIADEDNKLKGYSESMDQGEDKEFLKLLIEKVIEKIEIIC